MNIELSERYLNQPPIEIDVWYLKRVGNPFYTNDKT